MNITLRKGRPDDAQRAGSICYEALKVLAEGPNVHAGHDYFLSTDLLNAVEIAAILSSALDREIPAVVITPQELRNLVDGGHVAVPSQYDAAYAASALNWLQQTYDGRMDYSAVVTSTVTDLLSREPIHLAQWAQSRRSELLDQLA